ncbi:MAG TPA: zinc ribbon domain-containing protein [Pyrinomonadaceae bacterium]|nr:zinc ribbon domain-containing protein [Pyrinomonadaceae bacterium]
MFCPQCGHQQPSNEMRFCSRCGLSLGLATDLLPTSGNQLQREKRELMGVGLMMATVLMLVNFFLVFGLVTLPHLGNRVFLWLWLTFLVTALSVGGVGLANLIRGGFFKRLKERDARVRLMDLEQERRSLLDQTSNAKIETPAKPAFVLEPRSVTETTTRELER